MNRFACVFWLVAAVLACAAITPKTPGLDKDGCYSINNVEELYGYAQLMNATKASNETCARLEADIVINEGIFEGVEMTDTTFPQPLCVQKGEPCPFEEWTPIGTARNMFNGHFDGQGHTVSGVFINRPEGDSIGFFGGANGLIENLNIADSYISGLFDIGGIVGSGRGYIFYCTFSGAIEGERYVGGIGGDLGGFTVNCRNDGYVRANRKVGGIIGNLIYVVEKCVNTGHIFAGYEAGGIVGFIDNGYVGNSYNLGVVNAESSAGGIVGKSKGWLDRDTLVNCFNMGQVSGNYGMGSVVGQDSGITMNSYALVGTAEKISSRGESDSVRFLDESAFTDGSLVKMLNTEAFIDIWEQGEKHPVLKDVKPKMKDGVFQIENEEQFMWFEHYINRYKMARGYLKFALVNDLVFNKGVQAAECVQKDTTCDFVEWTPIFGYINGFTPGFHGEFDGQFHTISGLYSSKASGLFESISPKGTVKNVILLDSYFAAKDPGSIAGRNYGTIIDCYSDALLKNLERGSRPIYVLGMVPKNEGQIIETRVMNENLWFDGKTLVPYRAKVCESREEKICEPSPEIESTSSILYSVGDSYIAYPYQKEWIDERVYPHRYSREAARVTMDSLGYLPFKYYIGRKEEPSYVGFWFGEGYLSSSGAGVDLSSTEGICVTYTSEHDISLDVSSSLVNDSVRCSVTLPKSKDVSTVETAFKDYKYTGKDASVKACSDVFSKAKNLSFTIMDSVRTTGTARLFEFGPKGTCKGDKKIAKESDLCYAGSKEVCKQGIPIAQMASALPSTSVLVAGKAILFRGFIAGSAFEIVTLRGETAKRGFVTSVVDASNLKSGVYLVRVRAGARSLVKKVLLR